MTKPHDYADDTDDGNDHKNDNDTGSTPDRTSMANKNRPKIDETNHKIVRNLIQKKTHMY